MGDYLVSYMIDIDFPDNEFRLTIDPYIKPYIFDDILVLIIIPIVLKIKLNICSSYGVFSFIVYHNKNKPLDMQ